MTNKTKQTHFGLIMAIYLLGIFMGAIDTGIVTPARTIIQNSMNVSDKTGIWMITIYTLAYAASIPIMGKMADKYGRKYIYLISIFLFGSGSLLCGLSQDFNSFTVLLIARVIQAIGGGGILPIATAEFGTTFPIEKRGMALGLVGGVYGIANIFGSSAGSAIMDIFGKDNWQYIFYINIPITIFILAAGFLFLQNNKAQEVKKTDVWGILFLTAMVLSILYGLKNIDFFNFLATLGDINVYPFLIIFAVLLPLFIWAEKKAQDPVMNLGYFTNQRIVTTLILSFVVGIVMMGMIFVPQFSENAVKIPSGSGGYFVIILGLFSGVGAPMSGRLIDKFGAKLILAIGFIISAIGALFLVFVAANNPNMFTVVTGLILIGLGMGFTIGTPLNYMMLENTRKEESNSALATLSLVRSIGTAIAPAIMIGFISHAGINIQANVMDLLPKEITVPPLPYAEELTSNFNKLKNNPNMQDKLDGISIPDLTSMTKVEINMNGNGNYKMSDDLIALMKASDVTNITDNTKILADRMFLEMTPNIISDIQGGIDKGISGINGSLPEMDQALTDLQKGYDGVGAGIKGMQSAVTSQKNALVQMENLYSTMLKIPAGAGMQGSILDMLPPQVKSKIPVSVLEQLKNVRTAEDVKTKINDLKNAIAALEGKITEAQSNQKDMAAAMESLESAKADMNDTVYKMNVMKDAVPGAFDTAKNQYLHEIDQRRPQLEEAYQTTLNKGFKQVYLTVALASLLALCILAFYKRKMV